MKKCFRRFEKLAGFKEHVRLRPHGVSRYKWGRDWLLAHGVDDKDIPNPQNNRWEGHYVGPSRLKKAARASYSSAVSRPYHAASRDVFLQTFEWRQLRMILIKKRGARCECCGASPKDGVTVINVDHIKPRRDFPELALTESNLQVLCNVCNHGKGNWDQTDWRAESTGALTGTEACRIAEKYRM